MKKLFYFTLLILGTACSRQYQSVTISSKQVILREDGNFIFENDTLRIQYDFHSLNGAMKFSIYNKLASPIYVNWKESAFILGPHFSSYWLDQYVANGYLYSKFSGRDDFANLRGPYLFSVAKRADQYSFIPPQASLVQFEFLVKPGNAYGPRYLNATHLDKEQPRKKAKQYSFTQEDTPTAFRNYLTFSTDEKGSQKFVLDQFFWVSSVMQADGVSMFGPGFDNTSGIKTILNRPPSKKSDVTGYNRFFLNIPLDGVIKPDVQQTIPRQSTVPIDVARRRN